MNALPRERRRTNPGRLRIVRLWAVVVCLFATLRCGGAPPAPPRDPSPPTPTPPTTTLGVFVSPTGTPDGDGTSARPLDLATALGADSPARPGDTIWLRGGTYTGTFVSRVSGTPDAPITVRAAAGERVTLDGGGRTDPVLGVASRYVRFWGFEVTSSSTDRESSELSSDPSDVARSEGIAIHQVEGAGVGTRFINLVVHEVRQGFSYWREAEDSEIYGCLIYHNGWVAPDRGHGHGIYVQNRTGTKRIADNVIFGQFSHGIHAFGSEAAFLDNLVVTGNTIFGNGLPSGTSARNMLIGGGRAVTNLRLTSNATYYRLSDNGTNQLGQVAGCVDASVTQNVFAGGGAMKLINCLPATMTRNLLVGGWEPSNLPALFPENTYETGLPGEATILVRPNEYESGRALVTVFNWRLNGEITADLSSAGFRAGDRYEVYDVQNYFGGPVRSGVLTDATVRLPMTGLGVAPPVGGAPVPPRHTAPEFAAFVVVKR